MKKNDKESNRMNRKDKIESERERERKKRMA